MTAPRPSPTNLDWRYVVARSGPAGRAWIDELSRPAYGELAGDTDTALALMRRGQHHAAKQLLDSVDSRLRAMQEIRPSIRAVLGRFYHGVLAYHHYCAERFALAQDELCQADACVRQAVLADRVLLPLAHDCHEFQLHHARITRNQGRFGHMRDHLRIVRGMIEDRIPLCELDDGSRVDYSAIEAQCAAASLDDGERQAFQPLVNGDERRRQLDRFIVQLYSLPGFVIPYS